MAILVYNSTKQQASLFMQTCNESFIFVADESLNFTIKNLFMSSDFNYHEGKMVMIFKDILHEKMEKMISNFQKMNLQCIYAVYNENNQQWLLRDLLQELYAEEKWFVAKGKLEALLKKCNQISSFNQQEKEKLMNAYICYQQSEVDMIKLEESINDLLNIID